MTPAIRTVLDRAKKVARRDSAYVITTKPGEPYAPNGIGTAWKRARKRAGLEQLTLKDLRAKAITDAKLAGYQRKQLSVGAAHTSEDMTEHYIRIKETPVSEVIMSLPPVQNDLEYD